MRYVAINYSSSQFCRCGWMNPMGTERCYSCGSRLPNAASPGQEKTVVMTYTFMSEAALEGELRLLCDACGGQVSTVEAGDDLDVILGMVSDHVDECAQGQQNSSAEDA